ncbi:hypothetical protein CFC21_021861, partial [Triticum aestivum]
GADRRRDSASCSTAATSPEAVGWARAAGRAHQGADLVAGELLARIQKLKQDVQKWRSNVEGAGQDCHTRACGGEGGVASEVQHLNPTSRKSGLLSRKRRQARKRSKPGRHKTRYSRLVMNRRSNKLRCKH